MTTDNAPRDAVDAVMDAVRLFHTHAERRVAYDEAEAAVRAAVERAISDSYDTGFHNGKNDGWQDAMESIHAPEEVE